MLVIAKHVLKTPFDRLQGQRGRKGPKTALLGLPTPLPHPYHPDYRSATDSESFL